MPVIPETYANVLIPALNSASPRAAAVTFGIRNDAGTLTPGQLAEDVWDQFAAFVLPLLDSDVTWGPIHVQLGVSGGIISGDGTSSALGGAGINSVPGNTAVLVQKQSLTPGRHGRGRYYWPWAANEADVSETGVWNGASVANFNDAQEDFRSALVTADIPMVILRATAGTPASVTTLATQALLATQRRRMRP